MKKLLVVVAVVLAVVGIRAGDAAETPEDPLDENMRNMLDMMFSEINTGKIETINEVLRLTESEADVFWPIYREYEAALEEVGTEKAVLIRDFLEVNAAPGATDAEWNDLAKRMIRNRQHRLDLWEKYHRKISREVSAVRAAQFLQLENQMAILIDLNIATEMPLVSSP